jgi:hypothetical protein
MSKRPVVCMDEKPYQLLGEARKPLPTRPGSDLKADSDYVRNGTCSIFVFTEPLSGTRHVSVHAQRTALEWAHEIKYLSDAMYPDAEKIILVMDNLNTHKPSSLFSTRHFQRQKHGELPNALRYTLLPNMAVGWIWPR